MRILLVEDDEKLNQSLVFQLEKEGFQVDACQDGEEALYFKIGRASCRERV